MLLSGACPTQGRLSDAPPKMSTLRRPAGRFTVAPVAGVFDLFSGAGAGKPQAVPASWPAAGTTGVSATLGGRDEQEDAYCVRQAGGYLYAGVFDGHGGSASASFMCKNMHSVLEETITKDKTLRPECVDDGECAPLALGEVLQKTFGSADERLLKFLATSAPAAERQCGTTATVAMLWPRRLYVAHCGDSRAVIGSKSGGATDLTKDHRPSSKSAASRAEAARVTAAGGWVAGGRVLGLLAVSRALGDPEFKAGRDQLVADGVRDGWWTADFAKKVAFTGPLVTSTPDVSEVALAPGHDHDFLVIATDGLWDVCTSEAAVRLVRKELLKGAGMQGAADALVLYAKGKGTQDNVAVVLIKL